MKPAKHFESVLFLYFATIVFFSCGVKNGKVDNINEGTNLNKSDFEFNSKNDSIESHMELNLLNDTVYKFKFSVRSLRNNCNHTFNGLMKNLDPNADFDELDPNEQGEATQLFEYIDKSVRIEMAIPYYNPKIIGVRIENYSNTACLGKIMKIKLKQ